MDDYVLHWGVRGMRWGVRRYQNKDGSLTPAGKKRYNKELEKLKSEQKTINTKLRTKAKLDKLESMRKEIEEQKASLKGKTTESSVEKPKVEISDKAPKKGNIKKMSMDELKTRKERLELEKEVSKLEKETLSRGKSAMLDVLEASGKNIGTQLATFALGSTVNKLAEKFGVKTGTKITKLEDGSEVLEKIFEEIVNPKKGQKDK